MSGIDNSASLITDSTAIPSITTKDDTRPMSKSKMITAAEKAALEGKNEEWDTQMCTELQNEFLSSPVIPPKTLVASPSDLNIQLPDVITENSLRLQDHIDEYWETDEDQEAKEVKEVNGRELNAPGKSNNEPASSASLPEEVEVASSPDLNDSPNSVDPRDDPNYISPKWAKGKPKKWQPFLTSFTCFPDFPLEIRQAIWKLTLEPRVVEIQSYSRKRAVPARGAISHAKIPKALSVCVESRKAVKGLYPFCFGNNFFKPNIVFNFAMDTLYFDSSFGVEVYSFLLSLKEIELNSIQSIAIDSEINRYLEWDEAPRSAINARDALSQISRSMPSLKEVHAVCVLDQDYHEHGFPEGDGSIELMESFSHELQQYMYHECFHLDDEDAESDCQELPDMSSLLDEFEVPTKSSVWGWRPTELPLQRLPWESDHEDDVVPTQTAATRTASVDVRVPSPDVPDKEAGDDSVAVAFLKADAADEKAAQDDADEGTPDHTAIVDEGFAQDQVDRGAPEEGVAVLYKRNAAGKLRGYTAAGVEISASSSFTENQFQHMRQKVMDEINADEPTQKS